MYDAAGWNGYKYWLAYTPFPGTDSLHENPSLAVSNDFVTWETPPGLTNPVVPTPPGGAFNADVHIVLSPDKATMYMLYRERWPDNYLKISSSADGVTWAPFVTLRTGVMNVQDYASPSMFFWGGQWVIVYHNTEPADQPLERMTCAVGGDPMNPADWSAATTVTLAGHWWHSHLVALDNGDVVGLITEGPGSTTALSWIVSEDGGQRFSSYLLDPTARYYRSALAVTGGNAVAGYDLKLVLGVGSWTPDSWYFYGGDATYKPIP